MSGKALVQMVNITKKFPGVLANDHIDLEVQSGEILALLGENGSGKSTLMSILSGLYRPDQGQILVDGQVISLKNPRDAIAAGIGMVHQHFKLVETFTVAENVVLGSKNLGFVLRMEKAEKKLAKLSEDYGLKIAPSAKIWQLSMGERQRVEIVKMLYRGSKILILDEPTAVLTPQEARELFNTLRKMKECGHAIILITHKMQEVMEIADRVTVLRSGKSVASLRKEDVNPKKLANLMIGEEFSSNIHKEGLVQKQKVLEMTQVCLEGKGHRNGLKNINLSIAGGEIFGIAGIAGNGRRELAEAIVGLQTVQSGQILVDGKEITNNSVRKIIEAGVAYVPADRLGTGLIPTLGVLDNLILKNYRSDNLLGGIGINIKKASVYSQKLVDDYDVKLTGLDAPVRLLSGGNQQRLLLARELSQNPRLVVAVFPSRGLDIAATEAVHKIILEQADRGSAILLISEDLDELFELSDRIGVLYNGSIKGVLPTNVATVEQIGLMMLGSRLTEGAAS